MCVLPGNNSTSSTIDIFYAGSLERSSRRLRSGASLVDDVRGGAPHPSPTKGLPALSLLDINPAGTDLTLQVRT